MTNYKVLIPCRSDKKKKQYDVGDTVKTNDFPKSVIENWLKIGVLEKPDDNDDDESVENSDEINDNKNEDGD